MKPSIPDTLLAWIHPCNPQKHRFILQYTLEPELAIGISYSLYFRGKRHQRSIYTNRNTKRCKLQSLHSASCTNHSASQPSLQFSCNRNIMKDLFLLVTANTISTGGLSLPCSLGGHEQVNTHSLYPPTHPFRHIILPAQELQIWLEHYCAATGQVLFPYRS